MKAWFRNFFTTEHRSASVAHRERVVHRGPSAFADDNNAFALHLFGQLRQQSGNLFFSPFSVRTALAMAYAGARGATAGEIRDALHFPAAPEELHSALGEIVRRLHASIAGGEYQIAIANSLWVQQGAPLESAFVALLESSHGDCLKSADFRHTAEAVCARINLWVEEATNGRIRQLIPPGGVNAESVLLIVNAVYFKAKWSHPFHPALTRLEPFHLDAGGEVRAHLMRCQNDFLYEQTNDFQAVELPYRCDELSMLVLLPTRKDGLRRIEETLSIQMLNHTLGRMRPRAVDLALPRFTMSSPTIEMRSSLKALGVRLAFDATKAEFSGINGRLPPDPEAVVVSDVLHKAFVDVNERGTEAAAATAVVLLLGSTPNPGPPPVVFRADHPFVFAIRDQRSGAILFLGRMMDPTRS